MIITILSLINQTLQLGFTESSVGLPYLMSLSLAWLQESKTTSEPEPRHPHWSVQIADLRRQGESQDVATNSSTAEVHLFERLMQTQGGGDGSSTSPTVNGADAEERYWTSPPVKYESVCMRAYVCVWVCVWVCVCVCARNTSYRTFEFRYFWNSCRVSKDERSVLEKARSILCGL